MRLDSHTTTVAPIKKATNRDSLQAKLAAVLFAREAVRQAFFSMTGIRTVPQLRNDGKIWLEIARDTVA